jgi:alpha-L-fucosidase 2
MLHPQRKSLLRPVAAFTLLGLVFGAAALSAAELTLWSGTPAAFEKNRPGMNQALPIGNGMQGSLVFGGVAADRMVINDISLWTGDANPSGADKTMGDYQCGSEVQVDFTGQDTFSGYRRELDLSSAVARVTYTVGSTTFNREYFASHPDQVQVARYTASQPGALSGSVALKDLHNAVVTAAGTGLTAVGQLANGLEYGTQVRLVADGGTVTAAEGRVNFSGCNSLTLLWTIGTDYVMDGTRNWKGAAPHPRLTAALNGAAAKSYATLKDAHVAEYRRWFDRVSLDLGAATAAQAALTSEARRLEASSKGDDAAFAALQFQYGRYLLISCSRPGGLPANLQGLWNDINTPAWHSDYHTNINIQMNYWPAEVANLSQCHVPLFDLIESQIPEWRKATAAEPLFQLPDKKPVRGWTVRTSHNTRGGMGWKWDNTSNAWYALHFWEHYAFTRDREFLAKRAYPVLKEVTEFWEDHLKRLPDGTVVVPNGWSPEHGPDNVDGTAYCQQIVHDLFTNYIEASQVLEIDADYRARVVALRAALAGPKIGRWGQLFEWSSEKTAVRFNPGSDFGRKGKGPKDKSQVDQATERLLAKDNPKATTVWARLSPAVQAELQDPATRTPQALCNAMNAVIDGPSLAATPAFADIGNLPRLASLRTRAAADPALMPLFNRCVLVLGLGWSGLVDVLDSPADNHRHTSHLFAVFPGRQISRELTPELAEAARVSLDGRSTEDDFREWSAAWRCNLYARLRDGESAHQMLRAFHRLTTPNLFGNHPPMQIDGNFGSAAGIAEMLVQSHTGTIELLPALPKAWATGSVKGLRARGGVEVEINWKDGVLTQALLKTAVAGPVNVRYGAAVVTLQAQAGGSYRLDKALALQR